MNQRLQQAKRFITQTNSRVFKKVLTVKTTFLNQKANKMLRKLGGFFQKNKKKLEIWSKTVEENAEPFLRALDEIVAKKNLFFKNWLKNYTKIQFIDSKENFENFSEIYQNTIDWNDDQSDLEISFNFDKDEYLTIKKDQNTFNENSRKMMNLMDKNDITPKSINFSSKIADLEKTKIKIDSLKSDRKFDVKLINETQSAKDYIGNLSERTFLGTIQKEKQFSTSAFSKKNSIIHSECDEIGIQNISYIPLDIEHLNSSNKNQNDMQLFNKRNTNVTNQLNLNTSNHFDVRRSQQFVSKVPISVSQFNDRNIVNGDFKSRKDKINASQYSNEFQSQNESFNSQQSRWKKLNWQD